MAAGVFLTASSVSLAGWWAAVNSTPELQNVILVMTLIIPLHALIVVQEALLYRDMDFRGLTLRTTSAALGGGAVGLAMALNGFGVWALVAQHLVKSLIDVIVLWRLSKWRPALSFSWRHAKELLGFSMGSALAGFGGFVNDQADSLLIGIFFGPAAVGLYRLAARLVDVVTELTGRALAAVSLPELSRLQADPTRFIERFKMIATSSALVAIPICGVLAGSSDTVMALLGDKWVPAADVLKVLCVIGAVRALTNLVGPVLSAVGKPHVLAAISWISAATVAASLVLAGVLLGDASLSDQVVGIATVRVAMFATVALFLTTWSLLRYTPVDLRLLGRAYGPATLAGLIGFVSSSLLARVSLSGVGVFFDLLFVAGLSALVVFVVLLRLEPLFRSLLFALLNRSSDVKPLRTT